MILSKRLTRPKLPTHILIVWSFETVSRVNIRARVSAGFWKGLRTEAFFSSRIFIIFDLSTPRIILIVPIWIWYRVTWYLRRWDVPIIYLHIPFRPLDPIRVSVLTDENTDGQGN